MRIVSLLPSTTEILYAVGAGEEVVGVTFECDEPAGARSHAAVVSTSSLPEHVDGIPITPAQIDATVREKLAAGEDLYHLDRAALSALDADLVITQDLCAVCAVDVSEVRDALDYLGCTARVLTTDPQALDAVLDSIQAIGDATDRSAEALSLLQSLRARLAVMPGGPAQRAPRVAVLEWTDPPFAPGHWVPEMVTQAGGRGVFGDAGGRSVPISWDDVARARPDIVVVAPCGFDLPTSQALTEDLLRQGPLAELSDGASGPAPQVWAVDANASFARPGPRLIDGVEALASIIDPARFGPPARALAQRCR